jgi:acyl-CoA reductase-like NAD-dependent aldehyde dehydrogenase
MLKLKDPKLLRQQAYINGEWLDADNGATLAVTNPATGEQLGTIPLMGAAETKRASRQRGLAGLAQEVREGTRCHPAQVE